MLRFPDMCMESLIRGQESSEAGLSYNSKRVSIFRDTRQCRLNLKSDTSRSPIGRLVYLHHEPRKQRRINVFALVQPCDFVPLSA